jgi:predicted phosphoribosyltransferase
MILASATEGKTAIIIDDGLASGYTMLAAIGSLRRRGAVRVVAAAPVASSHAWELVKSSADDAVAPIDSSACPFAVAGFYRHQYGLTDGEVIKELDRHGKADRRNIDAT